LTPSWLLSKKIEKDGLAPNDGAETETPTYRSVAVWTKRTVPVAVPKGTVYAGALAQAASAS